MILLHRTQRLPLGAANARGFGLLLSWLLDNGSSWMDLILLKVLQRLRIWLHHINLLELNLLWLQKLWLSLLRLHLLA